MSEQLRVFLNGYIDVPRDRLAVVEDALPRHIKLTLAEPGCIAFSVTKSAEKENRFDVSEIFVDQSAFDKHQERTAASDWARVTSDIPREYSISYD